MEIKLLDENGEPINQIATTKQSELSPLLLAFVKVAYERDDAFKSIIDNLADEVTEIVNELSHKLSLD